MVHGHCTEQTSGTDQNEANLTDGLGRGRVFPGQYSTASKTTDTSRVGDRYESHLENDDCGSHVSKWPARILSVPYIGE